jgi:hypothetical protein
MLVALILGLILALAAGVMLLQRSQARKSHHTAYFSQTLGISDPAPTQAEDENPRPL